jgi:hypothetical protein
LSNRLGQNKYAQDPEEIGVPHVRKGHVEQANNTALRVKGTTTPLSNAAAKPNSSTSSNGSSLLKSRGCISPIRFAALPRSNMRKGPVICSNP